MARILQQVVAQMDNLNANITHMCRFYEAISQQAAAPAAAQLPTTIEQPLQTPGASLTCNESMSVTSESRATAPFQITFTIRQVPEEGLTNDPTSLNLENVTPGPAQTPETTLQPPTSTPTTTPRGKESRPTAITPDNPPLGNCYRGRTPPPFPRQPRILSTRRTDAQVTEDLFCRHHRRYRERAHICERPCAFPIERPNEIWGPFVQDRRTNNHDIRHNQPSRHETPPPYSPTRPEIQRREAETPPPPYGE